MIDMAMAGNLARLVEDVASVDDLREALLAISRQLGFTYFALSHHVDIVRAGDDAIRLHNYPAHWADYYDAQSLGVSDPVHRASHVTSIGFCWSRIPSMIPLTPDDQRVLALGAEQGIGDGFTVPANVPGEARGSCSFANDSGRPMPAAMLPHAQLVGAFAFEAARRLWMPRGRVDALGGAVLTDRQRDCVLWLARGKTDWEIGKILGVSEETVKRHVKLAREKLGVSKRTLLVIRALFDGSLSFTDVLKGRHSPFGE
jgi:LuxR family quorum-sensing system transcriptional regulator CciR